MQSVRIETVIDRETAERASHETLFFNPTNGGSVEFSGFSSALANPRSSACLIADPQSGALGVGMHGTFSTQPCGGPSYRVRGLLPAMYPEWLGDRSFLGVHKVRFPMAAGEMATGIATAEMVVAAAQAGILGFFGAAGLAPQNIEKAIVEIASHLDGQSQSWGTNLIHSPYDPGLEDKLVDLYLRHGVERISASAFMSMAPAIVRFSASGLTLDSSQKIVRRRHVFAKLSRPEVAEHFLSPAPTQILDQLLHAGKITREEGQLAARVPVAEDITVEADSGGHTDNRPLVSLLPVILAQRDALAARFGYTRPVRVGAAGGLGTPGAVAAAFSLGAAYVLTGSVNQSAVEAGTSALVKEMLAEAQLPDVTMAPAADMFELGVKVQVLKRGTMFASRANALYEAYVENPSLEAIPPPFARQLQETILRASFDDIWKECVRFWSQREPLQVTRAEADPKHRMALVFRWYLGNGSQWAKAGVADLPPFSQPFITGVSQLC